MSTSLQGSEHLALQSFTRNSKAPRGKKCGGIKPTLNVVGGHDSGLAQGVYPGGFDDTLFPKPVFRHSPNLSNRQGAGTGPSG